MSENLTPDELKSLFLFAELDDDQLEWLAERGRVVDYGAGAIVHTEGDPASCFFVLLSGTIAMSRRVQGGGGELELFRSDYRGAYTGSFNAWLIDIGEPQIYLATSRAVTDVQFLELPATDIGWAVKNWFPMAAHLMVGAATQGRQASAVIERHERLVALGAVTAGLTHELNNPAAAVSRATASLRERLNGWYGELSALADSGIDSRQLGAVARVVREAVTHRSEAPQLSPLDTSDHEDELAGWLDDNGVDDGWDVAPTLVAAGLGIDSLASLVETLGPNAFPAGVASLVYALEADALVAEVTEAAAGSPGCWRRPSSTRRWTGPRCRRSTSTRGSTPRSPCSATSWPTSRWCATTTVRCPPSPPTRPSSTRCGPTWSTTRSTPWTAPAPSPSAPGPRPRATTACWSRWPTPGPACRPISGSGSSSPSSPPRRSARAPDWASTSCGASS
jgi:CRP-like cAMP-binding protein